MLNNKSMVKSTLGTLLILTICLNYFEVYYHYWFVRLLDGYVIKIWLLPFLLFYFILTVKLMHGKFDISTKNISSLNKTIFFYIMVGFGALFVHEGWWNIGKYSLIMFAPLMLYATIIYGFRSNAEIERVLKLLFVIGIIFSAYTAYLYFYLGPDKWIFEKIQTRHMLSDIGEADPYAYATFEFGGGKEGVARVSLRGIDEPKFGGMLIPLVLIGLYYAINSKGLLRFFYISSSLFLYFMIVQTLARSSNIAAIAGLFLFFWYAAKKSKVIFTYGVILLILVSVIFLTSEAMLSRVILLLADIDFFKDFQFINNFMSEKGIHFRPEGHIESYKEVIKTIKDAPFFNLLGIGVTEFENKYADYRWAVPHNRYAYILNTTGFLTVIPYIGFIIALILKGHKTLVKKSKTNISMNNIGYILYPIIISFAIKINNEGMETYYYWIFFGLAAAWIRNSAYEEMNANTVN